MPAWMSDFVGKWTSDVCHEVDLTGDRYNYVSSSILYTIIPKGKETFPS